MDLTVEAFLRDPAAGKAAVERMWDAVPFLEDVQQRRGLVRYRGMVQDIPNPVYFYDTYVVRDRTTGQVETRSGRYVNSIVCGESEEVVTELVTSGERQPYYCVSTPALNDWAQRRPAGSESASTAADNRTAMELDDDQAEATPHKRARVEAAAHQPTISVDRACVVHIYDDGGGHIALKLNDVVEVVGFVYAEGDQDDVDVPPTLAPRLHALAVRLPPPTHNIAAEQVVQTASALRSELHLVLSQLLLGDQLAADYLLCHLLANIYGRRGVAVLGKFSLNLSNVPADPSYTSALYSIISHLVPKSELFSMSLQNMNSTDLIPVKDYETNRLKRGFLQLSDRTHLVVDETKLEPGQLGERGVKNVQTLNTLLADQVVHYDFKFYSVIFSVNIPTLVLSEGKTFLQCDAHVKLSPDVHCSVSESLEAVRAYLQEPLLTSLRSYLAVLALQQFTIPDELTQQMQNDLVEMRQDASKITVDEMNSQLVLARLLSLSFGCTTLTADVWQRASRLERQRRSRL